MLVHVFDQTFLLVELLPTELAREILEPIVNILDVAVQRILRTVLVPAEVTCDQLLFRAH